jgi:hypothetical protein
MGDFLVEVGEKCKETELFVDGGELVVGKDSFFKCEDFFPVHSGIGSSYLCQGLTGPCARHEQVWFSKVLAKQDLIRIEIKPRRIVFNKSSLATEVLR